MNLKVVALLVSVLACALMLIACSKSVEGTYNVVKPPFDGVTITLGKNTFAFSKGASGTYEVNGDTVIFTGARFGGAMKIEGDALVNDVWRFEKQN